ncbi:MAG: delta-lactam-biosynthetic de-N-acetylase [Ruminococcaceae bacterium]|nr:delta-lactam-biosynthetic de-N-acetylase [Oscillospiraceae bacterium]
MNHSQKAFLAVILCILISLTLPIFTFASESAKPLDWYFNKNEKHERPVLPLEFSFIEEYSGHYLGKGDEKVIYLTFDAGYENGNIEKILDALKSHNAPGAFFILENLINRNPELIKRMTEEGHLVCNHTAKHPDMSRITDKDTFCNQLRDMEKIYTEKTGMNLAPYYRPPQGKFSAQNLEYASEMGYHTIFWSFAYADWDNERQPDPEKAIFEILEHTHPGMVILLHPTSTTNAAIMDKLLTEWENQGYRFGTLDELTKK